MANTNQFKFDAPRPFYAVVGAGDMVVELVRTAVSDAQARLAKADFEPKAFRDQARQVVQARVDELNKDAKEFPAKFEAYINTLNEGLEDAYGDLAARGEKLIARISGQHATRQAGAAARTTVSKAKTTKTQTTKSARSTAQTTKRAAGTSKASAKKTGSTARTGAKSTTTAAKKTASAGTEAAGEAAKKVGD